MPPQAVTTPAAALSLRESQGSGRRIDRRMLIDGELVEAESAQLLPSVNPATGKILGFAPDCTVGDAARAVAAARRCFDTSSWSTDVALRVRCLNQLHAALVENREDLRQLTVAETGATWRLTEGPYLDAPIGMVRHHGESLKSYPMTEQLGEVMSMGRTERRWVEKGPAGVVAIVIGASHPMRMALSALGPALAAGCTVVLKGASDTALTTLTLGELIAGCTDIPAGVVNVLSSLDPAVDRVLAADRDIDAVHFTGSISAARRFMAAAGGTAKRISCTPERKSAAIVLDDADFSVCAAQVALMTTSNAGQGSAPISRLLVPRGHSDEVVIAVGKSLAAVQYGDPADSRTWMGPLISDGRRDEVDGMVKRAIAAGATLVTGGHVVRPGYFYEPTMLTGIDPDSEMVDVCGPVLVVIPYGDDEDAARIANRCGSGPSGVVFGGYQRAVAVARRVRTGRMSINGGSHLGPESRFGYAEEQGVTVAEGVVALEEYLERKAFAAIVPGV